MSRHPFAAGPVASPCTSVCRMNARTGRCEGCQRTLDEIAGWSSMSDDAKRGVLKALPLRRREHAGGRMP